MFTPPCGKKCVISPKTPKPKDFAGKSPPKGFTYRLFGPTKISKLLDYNERDVCGEFVENRSIVIIANTRAVISIYSK